MSPACSGPVDKTESQREEAVAIGHPASQWRHGGMPAASLCLSQSSFWVPCCLRLLAAQLAL